MERITAEMQDGEIVQVRDYHYTGTVNVWLTPEQEAAKLQQAIDELNAVPSYVERFARGEVEA